MVRLNDMNSSKRKEALRKACERVSIEFKTVKLPCDTRWNSKEFMTRRYLYLRQAIETIDDSEIPVTNSDMQSFSDLVSNAQRQVKLLEIVLPLLSLVASWSQILYHEVDVITD